MWRVRLRSPDGDGDGPAPGKLVRVHNVLPRGVPGASDDVFITDADVSGDQFHKGLSNSAAGAASQQASMPSPSQPMESEPASILKLPTSPGSRRRVSWSANVSDSHTSDAASTISRAAVTTTAAAADDDDIEDETKSAVPPYSPASPASHTLSSPPAPPSQPSRAAIAAPRTGSGTRRGSGAANGAAGSIGAGGEHPIGRAQSFTALGSRRGPSVLRSRSRTAGTSW